MTQEPLTPEQLIKDAAGQLRYTDSGMADLLLSVIPTLFPEPSYEYNVARMAPDGTFWDVFEDEVCEGFEDALKQRSLWEEEVDGDPVVVIRRVPPTSAGPWQLVQAGGDGD